MKKALRRLTGSLTILSLIFVAACQSNFSSPGTATTAPTADQTEQTDVKPGAEKVMNLGITNPPASFNTIGTEDSSSKFAEKFIFDSLLEIDGPLNFVPKLAEAFTTEDNQTYTVTINKDAQWTDGKPVSSDDVAFTLNLIANPKVDSFLGGNISTLEGLNATGKLPEGQTEIPSLKIVDEKTIQFTTKAPVDPNYMKEMIGLHVLVLPKHVLQDVAPDQLAAHPFMQNPNVTNGPFTFVQYQKDQYIEFAKNDNYYLGKPKLDKLFIKLMPAPNLTAQLTTGDIHMNIPGIGNIPNQDFELLDKQGNLNTVLYPTLGFQTMMFNTETLNNKKLRQAIAYAINRQIMVDNLLKGQGEVIDGPYTTANPYYDDSVPTYSYDPAKAKQLLAESGWDLSQKINLVVPVGNKVREQSGNIIMQNLQDIGLKVEITTYDLPTVIQKAGDGQFDLLLISLPMGYDPDVTRYYSKKDNFMRYDNPESDELLAAGTVETDIAKRKVIYSQLQHIWSEDVPALTLYSPMLFAAISKDVAYGQPKQIGMHYNVHNWDVAE